MQDESTPRQRQTASFLRNRFAEVGIRPDTRKGQNFLIDLNLLEMLATEAQLSKDDVVLEVGTGTGSLTALMAMQAAAVVTVEIDPMLHVLASEELIDYPNVTMVKRDVLRNKSTIHEEVYETLAGPLSEPGRRFKLVANLPYNIATPLISNLLFEPLIPTMMVVTIQKELADRITAAPNTKDYGALSVWVQSQCQAEVVRVLGPTVFWPRPKVDSAIIRITPDPVKRAQISDPKFFHTFTRALFLHRRKFLRSCLISAVKGQLDKTDVDEIMGKMQLGPKSRTEQLPVEQLQQLAEHAGRMIASREESA
jgi:16S rRNA (adenine1518-N6/adenine1519-N6)-dimethyltransferase